MLCELDSIANKVKDDLSETERITNNIIWHRAVDHVGEVQKLLVCLDGESLEGVEDSSSQCVGDFLNHHSPSLDFGKIQNVVNDRQEAVGKIIDNVKHLPLILSQIGV
ncbi:hypothetical protein HG531_011987 [Fusarium graminearum]|nr:hypothetical protein HG531_011987 [Fusarium graminearum]